MIYKEMEYDGCTPDRKARQMLQVALTVLERKNSQQMHLSQWEL